MPELPEVETVRKGLLNQCVGHVITAVEVREKKIIRRFTGSLDTFCGAVNGATIADVRRRGKYLIVLLDNAQWLVMHLGMTGKLYVRDADQSVDKHTHILFFLDNGKALHFNDVRRFGGVALWCTDPFLEPPLSLLGPEPLGASFTAAYVYAAAHAHRVAIKTLLLNQHIIAGLGNIYVDEALFAAGIRPRKRSDRLTRKEAQNLVPAIRRILQEAIQAGGSTIRDYRDATGAQGRFQLTHQVYGRGGLPCKTCATPLKKMVVGGRSSVYCPVCQKS